MFRGGRIANNGRLDTLSIIVLDMVDVPNYNVKYSDTKQ